MNHYTKNEVFSKFDQIRKGHTCLNKPACFGYRFVLVAMFFWNWSPFMKKPLMENCIFVHRIDYLPCLNLFSKRQLVSREP